MGVSLIDRGNTRAIQFTDADGKRRAVSLGKKKDMTRDQATAIKLKVARLVAASISSHPPDEETARWVTQLGDALHARLSSVGLVPERTSTELAAFLDKHLDAQTGMKPESLRKLRQTRDKLVAFFGAKTSLRSITPDKALDWRASLLTQGLSEAATKIHSGNAKTLMAEAVRRGLIPESPFVHCKSGVTASAAPRYITPEEADAVLDALPTLEAKCMFALARFAGLRVPSETAGLTFASVDFERGRLTVRSPKTERYAGHESREVPIVPKLAKLLQDRLLEVEAGQGLIVAMRGAGNVRRIFEAAIKRAEVKPWPKLFQALRSSCEIEWASTFPQFAVSRWIGHSIVVSGRHYANHVPDEIFDRATDAKSLTLSSGQI